MGIVATQQQDRLQLRIQDEMTIYNAAELKAEIFKYWDKASEIEVDLSSVIELDSSGVQLLIYLKHCGEQFHKSVRFIQHNPVVVEVLETLNLLSAFSDPVVITANGEGV